MTKKMLIETGADEVRVAIVEDGTLVDYDLELRSDTTIKGNIYKGIITNVERSLAAVFVDFGANKQGFLPFSEIMPEALLDTRKRDDKASIADLVHRHQEVIVQVTRDEMGHKGAALTSYLSIAGRYCVLMHSDDGRGGVSRKIVDEEARKKAREILSKLKFPEGLGVIVRTAGMDRTKTDLQRDLSALTRTWKSVEKAAKVGRAPTLLYREPDIVVRTIRDYLLPNIHEIIIDDQDEFDDAVEFFNATMPRQQNLLSLYQDNAPLFSQLGIEEQINTTLSRKVRLPSGGEIVIDQTEALIAIDVNSARSTKEKDHEETVYKTNLEAADEVAKQLRLRDLGGIVVIDFIDHAQTKHDRAVEKALKDAMKADKARTSMGRISSHGTLELTRQRLRRAHSIAGSTLCPTCQGSGRVMDPATRALAVLRELRRRANVDPRAIQRITAHVDVDTANLLLNEQREAVRRIEQNTAVEIFVQANPQQALSEPQYKESKRERRLSDLAYQALIRAPALNPTVNEPRQASASAAGQDKAAQNHEPDDFDIDVEVDIEDEAAQEAAMATQQPPADAGHSPEAAGETSKKRSRRRRGARGKKDKQTEAGDEKNQPTASNLKATEVHKSAEQQDSREKDPAPPRSQDQSPRQPHPATQQAAAKSSADVARLVPVSDDPLTEALFGPGPIDPDFVVQFSQDQQTSETDEAPKKKRRRRRRKPKTQQGEGEPGQTETAPGEANAQS